MGSSFRRDDFKAASASTAEERAARDEANNLVERWNAQLTEGRVPQFSRQPSARPCGPTNHGCGFTAPAAGRSMTLTFADRPPFRLPESGIRAAVPLVNGFGVDCRRAGKPCLRLHCPGPLVVVRIVPLSGRGFLLQGLAKGIRTFNVRCSPRLQVKVIRFELSRLLQAITVIDNEPRLRKGDQLCRTQLHQSPINVDA
jgi:hypothetical protein